MTIGVLRRHRYDAYGVVLSEEVFNVGAAGLVDTQVTSGLKYKGQTFDAETGQVYLRNRYYEPETGQFTQVDPARAGDNWYAYAGGDPINRYDPSGLDWEWNGKEWEWDNMWRGSETTLENAPAYAQVEPSPFLSDAEKIDYNWYQRFGFNLTNAQGTFSSGITSAQLMGILGIIGKIKREGMISRDIERGFYVYLGESDDLKFNVIEGQEMSSVAVLDDELRPILPEGVDPERVIGLIHTHPAATSFSARDIATFNVIQGQAPNIRLNIVLSHLGEGQGNIRLHLLHTGREPLELVREEKNALPRKQTAIAIDTRDFAKTPEFARNKRGNIVFTPNDSEFFDDIIAAARILDREGDLDFKLFDDNSWRFRGLSEKALLFVLTDKDQGRQGGSKW